MTRMRRALLLVIDGLGIGAMPDAPLAERGANTLRHVVAEEDISCFPTLQRWGLFDLLVHTVAESGVRAGLGYAGADSYAGQNEMLGGRAPTVYPDTVASRLPTLSRALEQAGHQVRRVAGGRALWVDEGALVYDNLEAASGLAINVAGSLQVLKFGTVEQIGAMVRAHVRTPRVIAFGSPRVAPDTILEAIVVAADGRVGIVAPDLGFYQDGYQARHFGAGFVSQEELPDILTNTGIPVVLVGKMADVAESTVEIARIPCVETDEVLSNTKERFEEMAAFGGLVAATVQATDLAGHAQDTPRFRDELSQVDRWLKTFLAEKCRPNDLVVLTADHGNDPTLGPHHTREFVPVLVRGPERYIPRSPYPNLRHIARLIQIFFTGRDYPCQPNVRRCK